MARKFVVERCYFEKIRVRAGIDSVGAYAMHDYSRFDIFRGIAKHKPNALSIFLDEHVECGAAVPGGTLDFRRSKRTVIRLDTTDPDTAVLHFRFHPDHQSASVIDGLKSSPFERKRYRGSPLLGRGVDFDWAVPVYDASIVNDRLLRQERIGTHFVDGDPRVQRFVQSTSTGSSIRLKQEGVTTQF